MRAVGICVAGWGAAAALLLAPRATRAERAPTEEGPTAPPTHHLTWHASAEGHEDGNTAADVAPERRHAQERPFAFLLDPTTPSAGDVSLGYDLGAVSGGRADRPLPSSISVSGVSHTLTLDYGWGDHITPFISARLLQPTDSRQSAGGAGAVGMRWQLTNPTRRFRLTLAAVGFREVEGSWGSYARLAASYDIDRLRIASNLHAERVFAEGRDPIDILVLAGLSYRVMNEMRVGVEYVGQDLEEAFDNGGAEGGARHYLGPSLALNLMSDSIQLVAGAGMALQSRGSAAMGRIGTLMTF